MSYFTETFNALYEGFFNKKNSKPSSNNKENKPRIAKEMINSFNPSSFRKELEESKDTMGVLVDAGWHDFFDMNDGKASDKRMADLTCKMYAFAKRISNPVLLNSEMKLWQSGIASDSNHSKIVGYVNKIVFNDGELQTIIYFDCNPKYTDGKNKYVVAVNDRYNFVYGGSESDVLKYLGLLYMSQDCQKMTDKYAESFK